jgi:glyoxylase-like metal-dependent hydrolase (beta-lactamase superfamily II)
MSFIRAAEKLKYKRYPHDSEGFVIHMLTSNEQTFFTNAYIVETKNALVIVDTMMINSDAALLRHHANDLGKPIIGVIITHGHPDHYNGTSMVIDGLGDIPIISTSGVRECIKDTTDAKEVKWRPYFGDEWPVLKLLPNQLINDSEVLTLDGLEYNFRDLGAAESSSDLYFTIGRNRAAVFVGDVVFNSMHGFMNDGNSKQWLQVLEQLLTEIGDVKQLFTGHGIAGKTPELIQAQIDYIEHYRGNLLSMINTTHLLSNEQKQSFEQLMKAKYPDYQLVAFITAGMQAVFEEMKLE